MTLDLIRSRLGNGMDLDAAWAAYGGAGDGGVDGFLAYLRGKDLISSEQFLELHGGDEIALARLRGVRQDRTLILEKVEARTMIAAGAGDATVVPADATPPPAAPTTQEARPSRYALLGCLGKGAMGEVHVARDEDLLRKVAYKRMAPAVARSQALAARFFSEIQVTAQLDHPHIVPIYGLEVTEGNALGYSMKLVQGRTLGAIIEEHRAAGARGAAPRLATRLEIFLKVCDAMAYAHAKGVLHRDLKPENIMVGRYNEVYVMDWGICRVMGTAEDPNGNEDAVVAAKATDRTQFGAVMGTPVYMSPEQALGKNPELDGRSDLFTLGLILQELVTLRPPRGGDSLEAVLAGAREGRKEPLWEGQVARELRAIIRRATAVAPERRYPTVDALAADLRRFLRGAAVEAQPDNPLQRAARFVGRHRAAALTSLLAVLVLGAAATIFVLARGERRLAQARAHEERVEQLLVATAEQAHVIDNHFYRAEGLLGGLAGRTLEALDRSRAAPPAARVFTSDDFSDPARRPPDSVESPYYHMPISLGQVAIKLAPSVAPEAVQGDAQLLASLRPAFEAIVLGSATANDASDGEDDRDQLVRVGLPILRAFVTLESGVHASYPGSGGFPAGYDGRARPKYRLAAGKKGTRWGNPYLDNRHGRGMLLPMSVALYAPGGELLGVAGFDATFDTIGRELLRLPDLPAARRAILVDDKGQVVIEWRREQGVVMPPVPGDADPDATIPLAHFAEAELLTAHGGGFVERGGEILAYERLASLGWTYVVVADRAELLSAAR